MRYVGLALYAEGPSDYYFLSPLLLRICTQICAAKALEPVDFSDVEGLNHPARASGLPRLDRIIEAAQLHAGAWQILFVHGDGGGDPSGARATLVQPALDAISGRFEGLSAGVAVVPVRETESWALCDGDALREVFGTTLSDRDLGIPPSTRAAETTLDPKDALNKAFWATNPPERRRRRGVAPSLRALGERVCLDRLSGYASGRLLIEEIEETMRRLRIVA